MVFNSILVQSGVDLRDQVASFHQVAWPLLQGLFSGRSEEDNIFNELIFCDILCQVYILMMLSHWNTVNLWIEDFIHASFWLIEEWPGRMMFWILQQCIPPAVDFMGKVPEMEMIFIFNGDSLFFWQICMWISAATCLLWWGSLPSWVNDKKCAKPMSPEASFAPWDMHGIFPFL